MENKKSEFIFNIKLEGTEEIKEQLNSIESQLDDIVNKFEKVVKLNEKIYKYKIN